MMFRADLHALTNRAKVMLRIQAQVCCTTLLLKTGVEVGGTVSD